MLVFGHVGISLGAMWALSSATGGANAPAKEVAGARRPWLPWRSPDFRLVVVGSMFPDIVDKAVWLVWGFSDGRFPAHILVFQAVLVALGLLLWWRYGWVSVWSLAAGSLLHTLEDEMWGSPSTYLWPAYGWTFPEESTSGFASHIINGLLHAPRVYVPEVLGAIIVLVFAASVVHKRKVASLLRYGTV